MSVDILKHADLIQQWQDAAEKLAHYKAVEMELRKKLIEVTVEDPNQPGTQNFELANGWKLKTVVKLNTSIDEAALQTVMKKLPNHLNDKLFKWKPALVSAVAKTLNEKEQRILGEALVVKPAAPSVQLVPPKEAKPKM